jgi:hypothetical protein
MMDGERSLIFAQSNDNNLNLPEIRAVVFPFAEMLFMPIKWIFSLIEAMLLTVIYCIRIMFRCLGVVSWYILQAMLYGLAEFSVKYAFGTVDAIIVAVMLEIVPPFLFAGMGTAISVSALKSYWYSISFWNTLKWVFIVRFGLWGTRATIMFGLAVYGEWRDRRKRHY